MLFAFVNTYPVFFIDSCSYVRSAAVATDSVLHTHLADPWRTKTEATDQAGGDVDRQPFAGRSMAARSPVAVDQADSQSGGERQLANNGITANRSIYYGALALLGYVSSNFWLLIFVQAYAAASCMALTAMRIMDVKPRAFLGMAALLSVLTCVGPFVAYVMADIFGATIILGSITLLLGWGRLHGVDRLYLAAVVGFSALAHNSNVLLLAAIFGAWLVWILARRQWRDKLPQIATLALLVAVGPVGLAAFSLVIKHQTGEAPLVMPHLTAHLVDMGPGTQYAKHDCQPGEFAVCEFKDILPVTWTQFIGGARDEQHGVFGVADLPTKRRLSDEQMAFAFAVFRTYPLETTLGMLRDGVRQFGDLTIADMKLDPTLQEFFQKNMPPRVWEDVSRSTIAHHPGLLDLITFLAYVSSAAGLGYAVWYLYRESRSGYEGDAFITGLLALLIVAVIANAAICGMLASPMGRFSARLVWLLPFAAMLAAMSRRPQSEGVRDAFPVPAGV